MSSYHSKFNFHICQNQPTRRWHVSRYGKRITRFCKLLWGKTVGTGPVPMSMLLLITLSWGRRGTVLREESASSRSDCWCVTAKRHCGDLQSFETSRVEIEQVLREIDGGKEIEVWADVFLCRRRFLMNCERLGIDPCSSFELRWWLLEMWRGREGSFFQIVERVLSPGYGAAFNLLMKVFVNNEYLNFLMRWCYCDRGMVCSVQRPRNGTWIT